MHLPRPLNEPGPLLAYLAKLRVVNPALTKDAVELIRATLATEGGAILLDLLEKSTLMSVSPILGDDRALSAKNAQALIPSDLRRIMSNETEQLLAKGDARSTGQSGRKRRPDAG